MRWRYKTHPVDSTVQNGSDLVYGLFQFHLTETGIKIIIADLMILTINTLKITMSKENIAYPFTAADYRFFALVYANGGNIE